MNFEWGKDFFAPGFGVFLGVVAGALIQFLLQWLHAKLAYKRNLKGMKFELEYAQTKINDIISALEKLRSAAATDTLDKYFYIFKHSDFLNASTRIMFGNSIIYKLLSQSEISKLLNSFHDFKSDSEMYMNGRIREIKEKNDIKEAALFANYYEAKLKDDLEIIGSVLVKIK